jgi:DNA-binding CsgD family transcriptional regulator
MLYAIRPTEGVVVLREITPGKPRIPLDRSLPHLATELLNESGVDLKRGVQAIVSALGFASFMYGMSTSPQPNRESRSYVWTTLPREWVAIYDEKAYIEIDPRLTHCWQQVTPFVWDRHCSSANTSVAAFLDHAAEYGVGSGVVVPLRDPLHPLVLVALNSPQREIDPARRSQIDASLGDIVLFASHFHELFMAQFVDSNAPPLLQGQRLSAREIQCLTLAAHGQTSVDIAARLGVAERTVNFHFCNILSKLGAANRHEAVAIAVSRGLITR